MDRNPTRLEALATSTISNVSFLGDLRGEALDAAYARADLFVLPGTEGLRCRRPLAAGSLIAAQGDGVQQDGHPGQRPGSCAPATWPSCARRL